MITINNSSVSSHTLLWTLPMALFAYKNCWYYTTGAIYYLCNVYNAFTSYIKFTTSQPIESIGGLNLSLSMNMACLNIQLINQMIILINFCNRYYILFWIANLISNSSFFKKGLSFYNSKYTLNQIFNDQKLAYVPIINGLFVLQVIYIFLIILSSRDSAFI